jgi:hypothetical protein
MALCIVPRGLTGEYPVHEDMAGVYQFLNELPLGYPYKDDGVHLDYYLTKMH